MSSRTRPSQTGTPSPTDLSILLVSAFRGFTRYGTTRFGAYGLSPARVQLITAVGEAPGIRMGTLARQLGVTSRAITGLVDALQAEGLLERQPDPGDRRAFRLALTDVGMQQLARIDELHDRVSADAFAGLSTQERAQFAELLQRVIDRTRQLRHTG
ncbi:MAG TPA: MarR family transcriptional regulator [Streptosporangiaceae bacterium]